MDNSVKWTFAAIGAVTVLWPIAPAAAKELGQKPSTVTLSADAVGKRFHARSSDVVVCQDAKVTAELSDILEHPSPHTRAFVPRLLTEGKCSPIAPTVSFVVKQIVEFDVPAGHQYEALGEAVLQDGTFDRFYVMQRDMAPSSSVAPQ